MDSSFVNYDGRSVHDMIEILQAASGDPEAVARLQASINAVDQRAQSSIAVVNAAIEQLEYDKQDAGKYLTAENNVNNRWYTVDGAVFDAMLRSSGYMQLAFRNLAPSTDTENSNTEWISFANNSITKNRVVGTSSAETLATWTADEDTGWLKFNPEDTSSNPAVYRKKDGVVFVRFNAYQASLTSAMQTIVTLPAGFRPAQWSCFTVFNGAQDAPIKIAVSADGLVQAAAFSGTTENINGMISFPVN